MALGIRCHTASENSVRVDSAPRPQLGQGSTKSGRKKRDRLVLSNGYLLMSVATSIIGVERDALRVQKGTDGDQCPPKQRDNRGFPRRKMDKNKEV